MQALDVLRKILTVSDDDSGQLPLRAVRRKFAPAGPSDAERVQAAREVIDRARAGEGTPYKPERFNTIGPRYADFAVALMGDGWFTMAELLEAAKSVVYLNPVQLNARSTLYTALDRDERFQKHQGRFRVKP